jgi:hypothetical protein
MTETALAIWLREHGETPHGFSRRHGIYIQTVYALCGVRSSKSPGFFRTSTLERIEVETGIPWQRLHEDWAKAEPRRPRKYTRKGGGDGVAAD